MNKTASYPAGKEGNNGCVRRALALGFAGSAALSLAAAAEQTSRLIASPPEEQRRGEMIFRRLGKTGEWVSLIWVRWLSRRQTGGTIKNPV